MKETDREVETSSERCHLVVLGGGPGGYTAAFRAADLGMDVTLVERESTLGGVCLNVGCIPSKALLHAAQVIEEAHAMGDHGVRFAEPTIDLAALRGWKESVVSRLTNGLGTLARKREVTVINGSGTFVGTHRLRIERADDVQELAFETAIIAAGSESVKMPGLPWDDERLMDSTGALALQEIPARLLVVGAGIIGMEMATVYAALGSEVTVVDIAPQLLPGADPDLVKPLAARMKQRLAGLHLGTGIKGVVAGEQGLDVAFEGGEIPAQRRFDRMLVAVGRRPNGERVGAREIGVEVDEQGFISVDHQQRTTLEHIFAIGDIVGQPMLAHKATHEAKVAAEAAAGEKVAFEARVIPSVAYTNPEIAWVGVTESNAARERISFEVARFPWAASGRALGLDRTEGFTKLIFDPATRRVIGAGIVGPNAGELIAECALAIEMGCESEDLALTIHPHPTLGESIAMAAEIFDGTVTDLYAPRKKGN